MAKKIVWKAFRRVGENKQSAWIRTTALTYRLGEVTEPKVGMIFAFKRKYQAQEFARDIVGSDGGVLKCEAEGIRNPRSIMAFFYGSRTLDETTVKRCWECWLDGKFVVSRSYAEYEGCLPPEGTVLCKSIKPIKEVQCQNIEKSP